MSASSPSLPALIADPTGLTSLVHDLARARVVAVDTESNSLFAYRERVCLIQFSTASGDYLVDPLGFSDLSALAPLSANQRHLREGAEVPFRRRRGGPVGAHRPSDVNLGGVKNL